jgi:hypothetical protein
MPFYFIFQYDIVKQDVYSCLVLTRQLDISTIFLFFFLVSCYIRICQLLAVLYHASFQINPQLDSGIGHPYEYLQNKFVLVLFQKHKNIPARHYFCSCMNS